MKQPPLKGAIGSESVAAMEPHELISYMIIYSPFKEMYTNLSNMWDAKIEEKICTKENKHTRQYLHGSVIYLHPQSWNDFIILREKI